jgi:AGZA family xanthine/uracil permease-like MFS transporter
LLLLIAGTALAWISGLQSLEAIKASMSSFGFNPPEIHVDSFLQGLPHALPYLASAVPLVWRTTFSTLRTLKVRTRRG